ncbi:hypothetical protein SALBM311S_09119 [Streptomyces alboniger]
MNGARVVAREGVGGAGVGVIRTKIVSTGGSTRGLAYVPAWLGAWPGGLFGDSRQMRQ